MAKGLKVRVRVDSDVVREVRELLGARSNSAAVERALTLALAGRASHDTDDPPRLNVHLTVEEESHQLLPGPEDTQQHLER